MDTPSHSAQASATQNTPPSPALERFSLAVGIIGMCLLILGNFVPPSPLRQLCFVTGALLMSLTALMRGDVFFSTLQFVVVAGALLSFAPFSALLRALIPIGFSLIGVGYFIYRKVYTHKNMITGTLGMVILAIGYALTHPLIYCAGGACLAIYSWVAMKQGNPIAWLWFVLNIVFTAAALFNSIQLLCTAA